MSFQKLFRSVFSLIVRLKKRIRRNVLSIPPPVIAVLHKKEHIFLTRIRAFFRWWQVHIHHIYLQLKRDKSVVKKKFLYYFFGTIGVIGVVVFFVWWVWQYPPAKPTIEAIRNGVYLKSGILLPGDPSIAFVFSKNNSYYTAYAGDKKTHGSFRMRIDAVGRYLEFTLLDIPEATVDVLKTISSLRSVKVKTIAEMADERFERVVMYRNVWPGTSIKYSLTDAGMKELIMLSDPAKRHAAFIFSYRAPHLTVKNIGNGVWYFYDGATPIFRIPKGWAKDAAGAFTNDVTVLIENQHILLKVNRAWIQAPDRVFPISIDPSIEIIPSKRK